MSELLDQSKCADKDSTLIAELLQPEALWALGPTIREIARDVGRHENSIRRLKKPGAGFSNATAKSLGRYFGHDPRDLFRPRSRDEARAARDRYIANKTGLTLE